mgnify:CR=1 FL=1
MTQSNGWLETISLPKFRGKFNYPLTMAFVKQAESTEKPLVKLSDVPLLSERCREKGFCKGGLISIEHIVPPGRYSNFTLVNYSTNVRMNVSERNEGAYEYLQVYMSTVKEDGKGLPMLMVSIRDREKGFFDIGTDDKKIQDWVKAPLGYTVKE